MITRRGFALGGAAGAGFAASWVSRAQSAGDAFAALTDGFAALERESGGRLGVALRDTRTNRSASYRGDEIFPMCSTYKLLAAAAALARVDAGEATLDQKIVYSESDLVTYSPATKLHAGDGMTLAAICEAAVTLSDNTAGNLMLRMIGGPEALTAFTRSIGDDRTRLDRWETALNEAIPGDVRDTTTPRAILSNVQKLALGDALKPASRDRLVAWLKGSRTGAERMRARLPANWIVGDKTGAGERGTMNDVGLIWPPDGAPILLAIYLTNTDAPAPERAKIIQEVGRLVGAAARP